MWSRKQSHSDDCRGNIVRLFATKEAANCRGLTAQHMKKTDRTHRLQIEVSEEEKRAIDDFWFRERLPSKSAAIRELLRRALAKDRENLN